jgi:hypothetical protein
MQDWQKEMNIRAEAWTGALEALAKAMHEADRAGRLSSRSDVMAFVDLWTKGARETTDQMGWTKPAPTEEVDAYGFPVNN